MTLTEVAARTGISRSTLSRLESGLRRPSLELLLPLTKTYSVPLDVLVGAPDVGDPRILLEPTAGTAARSSAQPAVGRCPDVEDRHPGEHGDS